MGRPQKFTDQRKELFLAKLAECGIIGDAAAHADISHTCVQNHRDADEAFDQAVRDALKRFGDKVEREFLRRALEGVVKPFFYQGKRVDREQVREYSDALLLAALKRHKPEYRERQTVDMNVTGGVLVIDKEPSADEWEKGSE